MVLAMGCDEWDVSRQFAGLFTRPTQLSAIAQETTPRHTLCCQLPWYRNPQAGRLGALDELNGPRLNYPLPPFAHLRWPIGVEKKRLERDRVLSLGG